MHVVLCDQIKTVNAKISEGEDNQRKGGNLYLCVVFGPLWVLLLLLLLQKKEEEQEEAKVFAFTATERGDSLSTRENILK